MGKTGCLALSTAALLSAFLMSCAGATPADPPLPGAGAPQAVPVGIPREYIPPPGNCRVWYADRSPDDQPPPERCLEIVNVPPGSRLVYGGAVIKTYRIEEYDPIRSGVVNTVNYFELESGRFLRQDKICDQDLP